VRYNVGVANMSDPERRCGNPTFFLAIAIGVLVLALLCLGCAIGYWYGQTIVELLSPSTVPIIWGRVIA